MPSLRVARLNMFILTDKECLPCVSPGLICLFSLIRNVFLACRQVESVNFSLIRNAFLACCQIEYVYFSLIRNAFLVC